MSVIKRRDRHKYFEPGSNRPRTEAPSDWPAFDEALEKNKSRAHEPLSADNWKDRIRTAVMKFCKRSKR